MAVLGKIRHRGKLLVGVIGIALFAFIAEEAVRSCETSKNSERQQIGAVLGKKISYDEFQKMVDEFSDVIKLTQGKENFKRGKLLSLCCLSSSNGGRQADASVQAKFHI